MSAKRKWVARSFASSFLAVAAGLFCTSCRAPISATGPLRADIVEAVLRHVAQPDAKTVEDSHGLNLVHKVYFLQVDGHDPGPEILGRLSNLAAPVKPLSSSVERGAYLYDEATGNRGAALHVKKIESTGPSTASADVDLDPGGPLRGSGFSYLLVKRGGKWFVVRERLRWVS